MIEITPTFSLDERELVFDFVRSSGPGGQNVNKVSTAVQLRFDISNSSQLSEDIKLRLIKLGGNRVTQEGILVIEAKRFRSQDKNRADALNRLVVTIQRALEPAKVRKPTRPTITARAARVSSKRQRGEQKRLRSYNSEDWE